jgi:hypothetical protein
MERVRGDIEGINMLVDSLNTHMASIYQLEMFYGDETLQGLIRHSKDVSFQMSEILERYAVEEEEEGFDNEEEEPVFHEGP